MLYTILTVLLTVELCFIGAAPLLRRKVLKKPANKEGDTITSFIIIALSITVGVGLFTIVPVEFRDSIVACVLIFASAVSMLPLLRQSLLSLSDASSCRRNADNAARVVRQSAALVGSLKIDDFVFEITEGDGSVTFRQDADKNTMEPELFTGESVVVRIPSLTVETAHKERNSLSLGPDSHKVCVTREKWEAFTGHYAPGCTVPVKRCTITIVLTNAELSRALECFYHEFDAVLGKSTNVSSPVRFVEERCDISFICEDVVSYTEDDKTRMYEAIVEKLAADRQFLEEVLM